MQGKTRRRRGRGLTAALSAATTTAALVAATLPAAAQADGASAKPPTVTVRPVTAQTVTPQVVGGTSPKSTPSPSSGPTRSAAPTKSPAPSAPVTPPTTTPSTSPSAPPPAAADSGPYWTPSRLATLNEARERYHALPNWEQGGDCNLACQRVLRDYHNALYPPDEPDELKYLEMKIAGMTEAEFINAMVALVRQMAGLGAESCGSPRPDEFPNPTCLN